MYLSSNLFLLLLISHFTKGGIFRNNGSDHVPPLNRKCSLAPYFLWKMSSDASTMLPASTLPRDHLLGLVSLLHLYHLTLYSTSLNHFSSVIQPCCFLPLYLCHNALYLAGTFPLPCVHLVNFVVRIPHL